MPVENHVYIEIALLRIFDLEKDMNERKEI